MSVRSKAPMALVIVSTVIAPPTSGKASEKSSR